MERSKKVLDAYLIFDFRNGNKGAFTLLVKRWHIEFCKKAYWYTRDEEVAKDIVQDSWQIILRRLNDLNDPELFGSWAKTIVSRRAIDWLRKNKKHAHLNTEVTQELVSDPSVKEKEQQLEKLKQVIQDLPAKQQLVIKLFYQEQLSIRSISELLKCSEGTVKSRLFTARNTLKNILKSYKDENE